MSEDVEELIDEEEDEEGMDVVEERVGSPVLNDGSTFWTACPYCFYMYEYHRVYVDCALLCQNCRRAFQAVVIPSPPPIVDGEEAYFCCWGFLPFGFSMEMLEKRDVATSAWTPFSPMFSCQRMGSNVNEGVGGVRSSSPRVYVHDNEVFVEISDSSESDDDRRDDRDKKEKTKAKNVSGNEAIWTPDRSGKKLHVDKGNNANFQNAVVSPQGVELPNTATSEESKMEVSVNAGKQPGRMGKSFGKLDLNVELNNEIEEPAVSMNQGNGSGVERMITLKETTFLKVLMNFLAVCRFLML